MKARVTPDPGGAAADLEECKCLHLAARRFAGREAVAMIEAAMNAVPPDVVAARRAYWWGQGITDERVDRPVGWARP